MELPHRPLIVAAVGLVSTHALWFRDHLVDDAFITMRYARHLAEGHGAVYNVGEAVEGYTSFLWMVLLCGAHALGLAQPAVAVWLGMTCVVAVVVGVMVAPWPGLGRDTAVTAGLLLACCGSFVFWGKSGLETGLFSALVLVSIWLFLRAGRRPQAWLDGCVSLTLALATLTRPEGVLVWLSLVVARWVLCGVRVRDAFLVLPYVVLIGAHVGWRWTCYGQLLPNTYYAKVGHRVDEFVMGSRYLGECLAAYGLLFVLAGAALWRHAGRTTALLAGITAVFVAQVVWVGGDNFPLLRFFAPAMPLLCLLAASGIQRVPSVRLRALVLAGACLLVSRPSWCGSHFQRASHDTWDVQVWIELGRWLDENLDQGQSVALNPVGAVGYHCRHRVVDMLGVNDATIARSEPRPGPPGHRRADAEYVLALEPTVVLIGVNHPLPDEATAPTFEPVYESDRQLLAQDALHERYDPVILATGSHRFSALVRTDASVSGVGER